MAEPPRNSYQVMLKNALRNGPWELTGFGRDEAGRDCELCGHKDIINLYFVREPDTGRELVVGSECGPNLTEQGKMAVDTYFNYVQLPDEWQEARADVLHYLENEDLRGELNYYRTKRLRSEVTLLRRGASVEGGEGLVQPILEAPCPEPTLFEPHDPLVQIGKDLARLEDGNKGPWFVCVDGYLWAWIRSGRWRGVGTRSMPGHSTQKAANAAVKSCASLAERSVQILAKADAERIDNDVKEAFTSKGSPATSFQ